MDRLNVTNERWDYLIILDACRYDYFEQVYRQYLKGDLAKKMSLGTCTDEWRDKSFPGRYDDIIYISANPQICAMLKVYGFCAGDHFHKVYEVWNEEWDEVSGTVLPEALTKSAIRIIAETAGRGKRYIMHYLQPHAPYLSPQGGTKGYNKGDINQTRRLINSAGDNRTRRFRDKLLRQLTRFLPRDIGFLSPTDWYLRKSLRIPPEAPMEAAWRTVDNETLRKAYRDNLVAALKQVSVLIDNVSGRIVVTSDHGELLGERSCYGHPRGSKNPILITVPWLVIEKEAASGGEIGKVGHPSESDSGPDQRPRTTEEEIAGKLRSLGYF